MLAIKLWNYVELRASLSALCEISGPLSQVHEFGPSQHTCVHT